MAALVAAAMAAAGSARGASIAWDMTPSASGVGGTGTWDLSSANWNANTTGAATTANAVWTNGADALFAGTAGTVTVDSSAGPVGAGNVLFSVNGYTLGGGTLTLNGASPFINQSTSGTGTTTISATLAGISGVTYNGNSATTTTFTVNGASTYTGATVLQKATVNFASLANDGTASAFGQSGSVTVGGATTAATVNYIGAGAGSTDRLWQFGPTGSGIATLANNGSGPISFTNGGAAVTGTASNRIIALSGTYTASANTFGGQLGDLTGFSTTVRITAGQWNLSGPNTYSGQTNVSGGATVGGIGSHAFGSTSAVALLANATVNLQGDASTTFTRASDNTPYSIVALGSTAQVNADQASAVGGATARTMTIGTVGTTIASANITYKFSAANNTSLAVGVVSGVTGTTATTATITNLIPTTTGTLSLAGYTSMNATAGETLTVGGVGNTILAGPILTSPNGLALVKSGTGTLTLLGTSTYTNGTNVSAGTVVVGPTGNLGVAGATTVSSTGVLAGNGATVSTPTIIAAGGTITGGTGATTSDGIGQFTTAGLQTWNSSGTYVAKVSDGAGTSNDTLVLSGGLVMNANGANRFTINLTSTGTTALASDRQLVLAFIPGAAQGAFSLGALDLLVNNVKGNARIELSDVPGTFNGVPGDQLIASVATPEPASLLLAGVAVAPLVFRRRHGVRTK